MKIENLVKSFANGATKGQASGGRVRIEGLFLYNYNTIIAQRTEKGVKLNVKKYSRTTTKLQNKIKCFCNVIEEYQGPNANIYCYW